MTLFCGKCPHRLTLHHVFQLGSEPSPTSPGWLGLGDILRLSRGRWGRGAQAPRVTGLFIHSPCYHLSRPRAHWTQLGSSGVCVCVCTHTCGAGRQGQRAGRQHPRSVWSGAGTSLGAAARGSGHLTAGHQVSRSGGRETGPATLYSRRGVHSPVVQGLRLRAPSREFRN